MHKFKTMWRKSLNYSIIDESYSIKELLIDKSNNGLKINCTILHSFKLDNNNYNKYSKEVLNYIFFLKKVNFSWKIVDLYNKEYFPKLYDKVTKTSFNYFDDKNNTISSFRDSIKIQFWKDKINSIEDMLNSYNKNILRPFYRSIHNEYDRHAAVSYARKYALNYNTEYKNFNDSGGDCTNFISQCLKAGGIPTSSIWKPYSNTWVRVNGLYDYLIHNNYGKRIDINEAYLVGDIIQFFSNTKGFYSHSGIISMALLNGDYLYCCHTYDKLDFPLSEIYPLFYDKFRVINIIY